MHMYMCVLVGWFYLLVLFLWRTLANTSSYSDDNKDTIAYSGAWALAQWYACKSSLPLISFVTLDELLLFQIMRPSFVNWG